MICRVCAQLEAPIGKRYCPRCQKAVSETWGRFQGAVESAAAVEVLGPQKSPAEAAAARLEMSWTWMEVGQVIERRLRMASVDTAVVWLPGLDQVSDRNLATIGRLYLKCAVQRGTEPDTVYVTGYGVGPEIKLFYWVMRGAKHPRPPLL